jgi:hypothetical protein
MQEATNDADTEIQRLRSLEARHRTVLDHQVATTAASSPHTSISAAEMLSAVRMRGGSMDMLAR